MPFAQVKYNGVDYKVEVPRGASQEQILKLTREKAASLIMEQRSRDNPEPSGDVVGRWKKWLTEEPAGTPAPATWSNLPGRLARGVGRQFLPGSVPEAATQGAIFASSVVAPGVGAAAESLGARSAIAGASRLATRVGLPAAAAAATGGSAAEGAIAAGLGEIATLPSLVGVTARRFGHLDNNTFLRRVRNAIGPEFAESIAKDIDNPAMTRMLRTPEDVARLVTRDRGQKILGDQFNTLEANISRVLRQQGREGQKIPIPFEAAEAIGWKPSGTMQSPRDIRYRASQPIRPQLVNAQGQPVMFQQRPPLLNPQGQPLVDPVRAQGATPTHYLVSPDEALDIAKQLRDKGRGAGGRMGQQSYDIYKLGEDVTQKVEQLVAQLDPVLAQRYQKLRTSYRRFVAIRDMIEEAPEKLLPGTAKLRTEATTRGGVSIDLPQFWSAIRQNLNKISPEEFRNLHQFFTGRAGTLSGPERTGPIQALRAMRLYMRSPGNVAAGETIPPFSRVRNLPPAMEQAIQAGGTRGKARTALGVASVPAVMGKD